MNRTIDMNNKLSFCRRYLPNVLISLLPFLIDSTVFAQVSPPESALNSLERRTLPEPKEPKFNTESPLVLPKLPTVPKENAPLSSRDKIFIKKFELVGNTIFSREELAKITSPYENREITAEELQEVKNKITEYYIKSGFINSGAIIPDQQVKNHIVQLKIIEGTLSHIDISGNNRTRTSYVKKRLEDKEGEPLNIQELQERLQLLQQNRLFKRINAELGPGVQLGEGILKVQVEENRPYEFVFRFNNHRSPSVGAYRGEIQAQHINLSGWGDTLYARYGLTDGLKDYTLDYSIPLNRYDTTLSLHLERSDSEVVSEPFNRLDVESEADTYSVSLMQPFRFFDKDASKELNFSVGLEKRSSKTFLLGRPFSFSPGVRDGTSKISVVNLVQEWLDRSRTKVLAARSTFKIGIDAFDATINQDGSPDSKFFSWLGQFQWVRRLEMWDSQVLFRTDLQIANQDLLPLEKFSIGGAATVRGYRENQLTRDNGLVSSLEWRIPIFKLPIPKLSKEVDDGILFLSPFIDYGRSWNVDSDTPSPKDLYSVGFGLRWMPTQKIHAEIYWGKALKDVPDSQDEDLQDKGIHFEISAQF